MLSVSIITLAALFALAPQEGQYRGPEYETLIAFGLGQNPDNDDNASGAIVDAAAMEGFDRWEFWFEINKDVILRSTRATRRIVLDPRVAAPLGVGRINTETADKEIFPLLAGGYRARDPRLSQAYLYGMGKLGTVAATEHFDSSLKSKTTETQKFGLLSMGLSQDRANLLKLIKILEDKSKSANYRAFAALGLGLRGSQETVSILKSFVERYLNGGTASGETRDLMVAAVTALGMSRDASAVPVLVSKYRSLEKKAASKSRAVRAIILTALGRIRDTSALSTLLRGMKSSDMEIRRAAALACGDLGDAGAVEALSTALFHDNDVQTRGFAALSLGRIGTRGAQETLRKGYADRKSRTVKSFCAIGLGLAKDADSAEMLRKELVRTANDDSVRGAIALGLGFLGDGEATEPLFEMVEKGSTQEDLRGYAAIAIGLIRPDEGISRLLKVLGDKGARQEDFLRGLLLGIGLFRDPAATPELIKVILEDGRDIVRAHAALAVGMTRDEKAVETLGEIVSREGQDPKTRIFGGLALGELGSRHNYPVLSETFFNSNYRLRIKILDELKRYF